MFMKRILISLGLLLGAAVAGFFQAGGLTPASGGRPPSARVRTADGRAPREYDARLRPPLNVPPPPEPVRAARGRPRDRRAPARWDDRGEGYRDGPSRPYSVRPPDGRYPGPPMGRR